MEEAEEDVEVQTILKGVQHDGEEDSKEGIDEGN